MDVHKKKELKILEEERKFFEDRKKIETERHRLEQEEKERLFREEEDREYQRKVDEIKEAQARVRKQLEETLIVEEYDEEKDGPGGVPMALTIHSRRVPGGSAIGEEMATQEDRPLLVGKISKWDF